jgi:hypothetical protein
MNRTFLSFAILLVLSGTPPNATAADRSSGEPFVLDGVAFESQAAFIESGGRCATVLRGRAPRAPSTAQIHDLISQGQLSGGGVIPVAFHVIYGAGGEGNVPEAWLDAQIEVLNRTYRGRWYDGHPIQDAANTGYTFYKASVDRTLDPGWFHMIPGSGSERAAKTALGIDPGSTLNLYTCKPGALLLGWATFPWSLASDPNVDGVVVHYASLPGGPLAPYNLGGTAVHEIGHWIGLLHTFQSGCGDESSPGCETTGDGVCDTPGEASAAFGCPLGRNTCPGPGEDPIHNYMDYTDDACYDNFTDGQDARADFMMTTYRPVIGAGRVANRASSTAGRRQDAWTARGPGLLRVNPNPFILRSTIELSLDRERHVTLRMFDVRGRVVATVVDRTLSSGDHRIDLDASAQPSGIYWLALETGSERAVWRVAVLK